MHDARPRPELRGPVMAAGCVLGSVTGLLLAAGPGGRPLSGLLHDNVLNNAVNGVVLGLLAGVLIWLRPANRLGWLVAVLAACNALSILGEGWALATYRLDLPGRALFAWLGAWPWAPGLLLGPTLLPLLYPTGRTRSRFAHRLAIVAVAAAGLVAVSLALLDDTFDASVPGHRLGVNPLSRGHLQGPLAVLAVAAAVAALLVAVLAWGHTLRRLSRAESPEREQLAWLLAMSVPVLVAAPLNAPALSFALQVLVPVGLLVGIVRHQLFDILLVLRSGLVYGGLSALAVGAYFAVVALITTMTPAGTVPRLFAVASVALVVVPAHRWLQSRVGRFVYGDRGDPIRALARVAEGIRGTGGGVDPVDVRPMLSGIAAALRSPYVAVHDAAGAPLAAVGAAADRPVHEVALSYAGQTVGRLAVAGRTSRDPLSAADRSLVAALAGPVAAAVRAALMAQEVAESRARVLAVRDAERHRLRGDLHDGLGPALSGVALGLEAARGSVRQHAERLPEILDVLHREVESLVTEVRAIIDDLGPGDVDLLASLRGHVEAANAAGGVVVDLSHTGRVDLLPGEVAVAAQRIAGEAFNNAVRHASATRIAIAVAVEPGLLTVEVTDDGSGAVTSRPGGVGVDSMRRRAESVGGILALEAAPGRGTRVRAYLPLSEEPR